MLSVDIELHTKNKQIGRPKREIDSVPLILWLNGSMDGKVVDEWFYYEWWEATNQ